MLYTRRYWVAENGDTLVADPNNGIGNHHVHIARNYLAKHGIVAATDDNGVYMQMFGLNFMRVVEEAEANTGTLYGDNDRKQLLDAQSDVLRAKQERGFTVVLNSHVFELTRDSREHVQRIDEVVLVMPQRYYVDEDGKRLAPQHGEDGHFDIARRYLASINVTPSDYNDVYEQMAKRGFMRVVEEPGHLMADNNKKEINGSQQSFLLERQAKIMASTGKKPVIHVNDQVFESTRKGREKADMSVSEILEKAPDATMGD